MEHLQNILFGEADQLFSYGARLLFSPSSSHLSRKGTLALDQESLSDSEDVALIRKSEKVSFGRRDQFWLGKSSTWKGSVSHNSLETGGWLEIYTGYIDWKWNWNLSRGLSITFWPTSHAKKDQLLGLVGLPTSLSARVDQGVFSIKRQSGLRQLWLKQSLIQVDVVKLTNSVLKKTKRGTEGQIEEQGLGKDKCFNRNGK